MLRLLTLRRFTALRRLLAFLRLAMLGLFALLRLATLRLLALLRLALLGLLVLLRLLALLRLTACIVVAMLRLATRIIVAMLRLLAGTLRLLGLLRLLAFCACAFCGAWPVVFAFSASCWCLSFWRADASGATRPPARTRPMAPARIALRWKRMTHLWGWWTCVQLAAVGTESILRIRVKPLSRSAVVESCRRDLRVNRGPAARWTTA